MQRSTLFACLAVVAAMSACAPTGVPAPQATSLATPKVAATGTIVSIRKVSAQPGASQWRNVLLADAATTRAASDAGAGVMEFIVRAGDGSIVAIGQANDVGFRTGDRVVLLHDGQTHLARPG